MPGTPFSTLSTVSFATTPAPGPEVSTSPVVKAPVINQKKKVKKWCQIYLQSTQHSATLFSFIHLTNDSEHHFCAKPNKGLCPLGTYRWVGDREYR